VRTECMSRWLLTRGVATPRILCVSLHHGWRFKVDRARLFRLAVLALMSAAGCSNKSSPSSGSPPPLPDKGASATRASPQPGQPHADSSPAPSQTWLVDARTTSEFDLVMATIKSKLPFTETERARLPSDTSSSYERRLQDLVRRHRAFSQRWRYYSTNRDLDASRTDLSKFVRSAGPGGVPLSMEWECVVFDARRWKNGGEDVLCSVKSRGDWDYSVIGYMPTGKSLTKGARIRFKKLTTALPVEEDLLKLRFVDLNSSQLRFTPVRDEASHAPQ
jgi:hypothetical protein